MIRRARLLLAATLVAVPMTVVSAGSASACERHPCQTRCDVNPPVTIDLEDGTFGPGQGPLLDCYY